MQEGANRALKPFRDLFGWFGDTIDAKGERDELEAERDRLRQRGRRACRWPRTRTPSCATSSTTPAAAGWTPTSRSTARVYSRSNSVLVLDDRDQQGLERRRRGQPARHQRQGPGRQGQDGLGRQRRRDAALRRGLRRLRAAPRRPTSRARSCPSPARPATCSSTSCREAKKVRTGDRIVTAGTISDAAALAVPAGHPDRHASSAIEGEGELDRTIHVEPAADLRSLDFVQVLTQPDRRPARLPPDAVTWNAGSRRPRSSRSASSAGSCS